jgi:hypothetical protein
VPSSARLLLPRQNEVPASKGRDFQVVIASKEKLGSTTLTIAVLVFLTLVLSLSTLLRLVLAGLAVGLSGLTPLLTVLSGLTTLLTLLLHVICHKSFLLKKTRAFPRLRNLSLFKGLVAARDCKGWERFST